MFFSFGAGCDCGKQGVEQSKQNLQRNFSAKHLRVRCSGADRAWIGMGFERTSTVSLPRPPKIRRSLNAASRIGQKSDGEKTVACSLHVITCLLSQIKTGSVLQISTTFSTSFNCFVDQTYGNLNGLLSIITTKPLIFRSVPQMAVLTVLDLYQEQDHDHSNVLTMTKT